jgi:folate-binding protein YgfZ
MGEPTTPYASRITRDVVRVSGPDAATFLQGQLSQDVVDLAVGATVWSFVLQPQGKVDAWVRVHRTATDDFALDVDAGFGAAVCTRLERFKLRTACDIIVDDAVPTVALRGAAYGRGLPCGWPGMEGVDLIGDDGLPDDLPPGTLELDGEAYDGLRIATGVPRMGTELTDSTIPAEVGQWVVDASIDFTKGCFTGQELVARIDSRGGNVPRRLRGFTTEAVPPASGADVVVDGAVVGTVTSSAIGADGHTVGLALVKRAVDPPVAAAARTADGGTDAIELRDLPLTIS